ncbi:MAG: hypothetical protein ABF633_01725 [Clostridium sp.]|uniref:hypothetical protein n=1 Tax=Clostridium sp. TaxID=1506 RepID=UPI0039E86552
MFTLQHINVVRIVATEKEKLELLHKGFKEIVEEAEVIESKVENKITKGKTK